ncbi:hypothetical protein BC567DRAFT_79730 [Phyllosticta citribraziliensis]
MHTRPDDGTSRQHHLPAPSVVQSASRAPLTGTTTPDPSRAPGHRHRPPYQQLAPLKHQRNSPRLIEPTDPCAPSKIPPSRVSTFNLTTCFMPQTPVLMPLPRADFRMWTITCPVPVQGLLFFMTVPEKDRFCHEYSTLAPGRLQQHPWTAKLHGLDQPAPCSFCDGWKKSIECSELLVHWGRGSSSSSTPSAQL